MAWALSEADPSAHVAVSIAKAYCSDAYREVGNRGIQVRGGIGFTWEPDLQLYYKRSKRPRRSLAMPRFTANGSRATLWTRAWNNYEHEQEVMMSKAKVIEAGATSPYAARPWLDHYDYWVRPHMNYPRRPLHEILRLTAVEVPEQIATVFLGAQLTYRQIKEHADKLATALARLGIKQPDRVGIKIGRAHA